MAKKAIIIGAGPAGLTAGLELLRRTDIIPVILEASHEIGGISRTIRVFFDLITIRFLLKYMYRPLHLFGTVGMLSMLGGLGISGWLMFSKYFWHLNIMGEHGPLLVFAAVLLVAGVQLLALGLLGDLQVRNFQEPSRRVPYTVAQVLRSQSQEQAVNE